MARTRKAQTAPEPEVEETTAEESGGRNLRGPSPLHEAHAAYLNKTYGVDITAEQVYLAQATRKEFRQTEGSGYEEALDAIEEARDAKAKAKADRAAEKAAKAEEEVEEATETPAPKRRGRKAAAPAQAEAPAEEQAAPATTRRRRGAKAAAAPATEEAPATPARKRGKAPF